MYLAHVGHLHSQVACILGAALLAAAILAIFVIFDIRNKRITETISKD